VVLAAVAVALTFVIIGFRAPWPGAHVLVAQAELADFVQAQPG